MQLREEVYSELCNVDQVAGIKVRFKLSKKPETLDGRGRNV